MSEFEPREFAHAFRSFLEWVHEGSDAHERNEVVALVRDFLGSDGAAHSVVTRSLAAFEQVNLQTALSAWSVQPGRSVSVHGITIPPHYGPVSLHQLTTGEGIPPLRLAAPSLADLPNGPGSTLACLQLAALLVTDARGRYVLMVAGPSEHDPSLSVELAGLPVDAAQAVHAELDALRAKLNVYRGHVIDLSISQMGGVVLTFAEVPATERAEVVLPEIVLTRVERHALGVAVHRDALLATGQHLKRGLLLFGPPGTGKTHTTRYLVGRMSDYTRESRSLVVRSTPSARQPSSPAILSPLSSCSKTLTLSPRTEVSAAARAPCCSTFSTPWTARRPTRICCSC